MRTDSAFDGGPSSNRLARAPHPGSPEMGVAAGQLAEIELPSGPLLTTRWGVMRDDNTSVWLEMERA